MGLSNYKVNASIAVSDIARAEAFYEGELGLHRMPDDGDGSHRYACGEGTSLHVYVSPANAGKATATWATWYVPNLEHVVDELGGNGVTFERFRRSAAADRRAWDPHTRRRSAGVVQRPRRQHLRHGAVDEFVAPSVPRTLPERRPAPPTHNRDWKDPTRCSRTRQPL
jgi:catechol 2,3-dioxygenase-like lactoylglutathione lyase family enzyme